MSKILSVIMFLFLWACQNSGNSKKHEVNEGYTIVYPSDTLPVRHTDNPPVIDGDTGDPAWNKASWYPINQTWIPYGAEIDSSVFYGRYKILWSEKTNVLYILAEITDNVFVGGYQYHPDPETGEGYPNYDILEIFIDENKSCERHVFNAIGEDAEQWGSNAEAAFAYHITIDAPADGQVITEKHILDITGISWSDYMIIDYQDHFPEFAVKRRGIHYTWEMSMKVFDDSYDHEHPEASRVKLHENKIMGFSVAYCNNDNPDEYPPQRDHFFGSVWVPEENYNDHWMDASFFGTIILMK